jgi:hypothetical protein
MDVKYTSDFTSLKGLPFVRKSALTRTYDCSTIKGRYQIGSLESLLSLQTTLDILDSLGGASNDFSLIVFQQEVTTHQIAGYFTLLLKMKHIDTFKKKSKPILLLNP